MYPGKKHKGGGEDSAKKGVKERKEKGRKKNHGGEGE